MIDNCSCIDDRGGVQTPIKKTKIRAGTSRILAETIVGPKKQPILAETGHEGDAPAKSPAQS